MEQAHGYQSLAIGVRCELREYIGNHCRRVDMLGYRFTTRAKVLVAGAGHVFEETGFKYEFSNVFHWRSIGGCWHWG